MTLFVALLGATAMLTPATSQARHQVPHHLKFSRMSDQQLERWLTRQVAHDQGAIGWLDRHLRPVTFTQHPATFVGMVQRDRWRQERRWFTVSARVATRHLADVDERIAAARRAAEAAAVPWYVSRQIEVAEIIGHNATADPWPNCSDPIFDGAASWSDTVSCENGGSWLDSPGYYRCGLQFDPGWERTYGRLCP